MASPGACEIERPLYFMWKRAAAISMAFIGVVVGAGFASGQEAIQYFVAFGNMGLWGVLLAAALMIITGVAILQLGSYFQADEHTAVYDKISGPIVSRVLDWGTLATLFSIGFVMFAGGGSTISQQFDGVPIWVGGAVMLVLVLLVGLLDVDKVSNVIGAITPFIIIFVVLATGYTIIVTDVDWSWANDYAINNVESPLNNWWLAALNYTGLNVMCAVSMSIVIGGNILDNRAVGVGGLIGGFFYLLLLALLVVSLYMVAPDVHEQDLPVLSLINNVNPILGYFMTFIIYGMVFNTAIGMFYAMGKRLTRKKPKLFYPVYAGACVVGFILSFIGFKQLVSSVYPILGWIGLLMIAVMVITWITQRDKITSESDRRVRARTLVKRRLDPREHFTKKNERELRKLAAASNMETEEFVSTVADEIHEELEADDEIEYDREDPDPSVTFVEHTKPEVPKD
ncbi:putative membrane protein [Corynebacterium aurimucosum ATCC 700975]|uniref:Putative membrane protein n=2 Tax=Corynebacterium aurimucosum TaxID=169292 RepID=C3PJS0_CORA7|nr:putative membrane protein [Corynebacterium aurimucosum ATCC 700975]